MRRGKDQVIASDMFINLTHISPPQAQTKWCECWCLVTSSRRDNSQVAPTTAPVSAESPSRGSEFVFDHWGHVGDELFSHNGTFGSGKFMLSRHWHLLYRSCKILYHFWVVMGSAPNGLTAMTQAAPPSPHGPVSYTHLTLPTKTLV